jgi:hypothetical protein
MSGITSFSSFLRRVALSGSLTSRDRECWRDIYPLSTKKRKKRSNSIYEENEENASRAKGESMSQPKIKRPALVVEPPENRRRSPGNRRPLSPLSRQAAASRRTGSVFRPAWICKLHPAGCWFKNTQSIWWRSLPLRRRRGRSDRLSGNEFTRRSVKGAT